MEATPAGAAPLSKRALKRKSKQERRQKSKEQRKRARPNKGQRASKKSRRTDHDRMSPPVYDVRGGVRTVTPYVYSFSTHAKNRWLGRSLLEVFTTEFGSNTPEYFRAAIAGGLITVNGERISAAAAGHVLKNGDFIEHLTHRHEPPVSDQAIAVLAEVDDIVAVDKPASIPCHPCGAYHHTSLTGILTAERPDLGELFLVHRLDRLTSGLLLLARSSSAAARVTQRMTQYNMHKIYLARVAGCFPGRAGAGAGTGGGVLSRGGALAAGGGGRSFRGDASAPVGVWHGRGNGGDRGNRGGRGDRGDRGSCRGRCGRGP